MPAAIGNMKREQEEQAKRMRQGRRERQEAAEREIARYWQKIDEKIDAEDRDRELSEPEQPVSPDPAVRDLVARERARSMSVAEVRATFQPKGYAMEQADMRIRRAEREDPGAGTLEEQQIAELRRQHGDYRQAVTA